MIKFACRRSSCFALRLLISFQKEKYYLRAVGDNARDDIANFEKDFPEIAADLQVPDFFEEKAFFSSVFRISSKGCQLWTHYDVSYSFIYYFKVTFKEVSTSLIVNETCFVSNSGTKIH